MSGINDQKLHLVEDACIGRGELEDLFNRFPSYSAYLQGDLSNGCWGARTCLQWSEVRRICFDEQMAPRNSPKCRLLETIELPDQAGYSEVTLRKSLKPAHDLLHGSSETVEMYTLSWSNIGLHNLQTSRPNFSTVLIRNVSHVQNHRLSTSLRSPGAQFDTTPGQDEILKIASVLMTGAFVISGAGPSLCPAVEWVRSVGSQLVRESGNTTWSSASSILTCNSAGAEVLVDTAVNTSAGAEVYIVSMTTGSLSI